MDDHSFAIRKQKVYDLISKNQWSEACFLLRKNFPEISPMEIEQTSWALLSWLKCCIHLNDYEQATEVIKLSQNRITSFNMRQSVQWLELHQELISSMGLRSHKQAHQLLLIWRKLSPLFAKLKHWRRWKKSNAKTLESLIEGKFQNLFWEPLMWWIQWSKDFELLEGPSVFSMIAAFELTPNTMLMDLIYANLTKIENDVAEDIHKRLHSKIWQLNSKLSSISPLKGLYEEFNKSIIEDDKSKFCRLLNQGSSPNGYPNHQGAWWRTLEKNQNLNFIEDLLANGAWVNARNKQGFTALMLAVNLGNLKLFKLLCKHGADPLLRTFEGQSLMHLAVKNKQIQLITILIDIGLCPDSPDLNGLTARNIALKSQSVEIIEAFGN